MNKADNYFTELILNRHFTINQHRITKSIARHYRKRCKSLERLNKIIEAENETALETIENHMDELIRQDNANRTRAIKAYKFLEEKHTEQEYIDFISKISDLKKCSGAIKNLVNNNE